MTELPTNSPEQVQQLDDNASKFLTGQLDPAQLADGDVVSFTLTVDWLETSADDETKLAHKRFDDGTIQILLISKTTVDGHRSSQKRKIDEDEYRTLLVDSQLHLEKHRSEFRYTQNGVAYDMKYDVFANSHLHLLEVDAASDDQRDAFDPTVFPDTLDEVTGDAKYYGYRVVSVL